MTSYAIPWSIEEELSPLEPARASAEPAAVTSPPSAPVNAGANAQVKLANLSANAGLVKVGAGEVGGLVDAKLDARVTGQGATLTADGKVGGVFGKDISASAKSEHARGAASVGDIRGGPTVENARVSVNKDEATLRADNALTGVRAENVASSGSIDGVGSAHANAGKVLAGTELEKPELRAGLETLDGSAKKIEWGTSTEKLDLGVAGGGKRASGSARLTGESFGASDSVSNVKGHIGPDGIRVSAKGDTKNGEQEDGVSIGGLSGKNLEARAKGQIEGVDVGADAKVGSFSDHTFSAKEVDASLDRNGLHASLTGGNLSVLGASDVAAGANIGSASARASVGDVQVKQAYAGKAAANLTGSGLDASVEKAGARGAAVKNADAHARVGGAKLDAHADQASVVGLDVKKLSARTDGSDAHLDASGISTHAASARNITASAQVGAARASAGAERVEALASSADRIKVDVDELGARHRARIDNAQTTLASVKNGRAGVNVDGKEVLGVQGSGRVGSQIEKLETAHDLSKGTASAEVKNAGWGGELTGTSVNVAGNTIAVPDVAAKVNASANADVKLAEGSAKGGISLAGSGYKIGNTQLVLPEAAQASAGVNLQKGTANANVGGANGVGFDVDASKGRYGVNLFGRRFGW